MYVMNLQFQNFLTVLSTESWSAGNKERIAHAANSDKR